ncbi:hypothetical protein [Shouchella lehensis]|uniref:Uncharacterized protein n=1 Tax=Shouchella lehensis G1 TaxID=1246626 RepID=A0A060M614_9BACI|nr:hypothetical protein [Shouchella lehensis]AIC95983.1 hypothetical protein BleG1_3436 [Shouchella lehensis G1]
MSRNASDELDFNHLLTVKTEPVLLLRTYIFTTLAKKILVKEQTKFLKREIKVMFPEAYVRVIQQALLLLNKDLLKTKALMRERHMTVDLKPKMKADRTFTYACYVQGKTIYTGGPSYRLKSEVMRYVIFYLNETKEEQL